MPTTSTPDRTAPTAEPSVVVEAASAELALAEISARLGNNASIVAADKVLRGGIGGFFARELVRLEAHAGPADAPAEEAVTAPGAPSPAGPPAPASQGVGGVLTRLAGNEDRAERSFEDVLRERLAAGPSEPEAPQPQSAAQAPSAARLADPAASAAVPPAEPTPAVLTAPAVRHTPTSDVPPGSPMWSTEALCRLGLPAAIISATEGIDPADDTAWIASIGAAVSTLCRPLPPGDALLAGPRARRLGAALGMATVTPPELPPLGSVATLASGSQRSQAWIAWARERRWLHLVAGGADWRRLLFQDPLAVSWVGDEALPAAVRAASELGLVLGFGLASGRGPAHRAAPVDVAIAIRAQVPRR